MTGGAGLGTWSPAAYGLFSDLRLRPALDLLARVPALPPGPLVDLGCGAGAAAPALRARFPDRRLTGVDGSAAMLAKATPFFDAVEEADIASWKPGEKPALIFSNAALHWLGGHEALIPRLAGFIVEGGALAVQMPGQLDRPSHRTMIAAAAAVRPDLFSGWTPFPGPLPLPAYADLLPGFALDLWETEYLQRMERPGAGGHPVRAFTSSTGGRPILDALDAVETARFAALWDEALEAAYPLDGAGGCWFPFRRVFFTARKGS